MFKTMGTVLSIDRSIVHMVEKHMDIQHEFYGVKGHSFHFISRTVGKLKKYKNILPKWLL